jgi:hypothetical protein
MLRTDAEDIEDDEVFIAHVQKMEARRLSPRWRCSNRTGGFLRFALLVVLFGFDTMFTPGYFFRFVHTAFSLLKKRCKYLLLFAFDTAFEIDLGHFLGFVGAIIVFIIAGHFIFVFTIVAQHAVLDVCADRITTTL